MEDKYVEFPDVVSGNTILFENQGDDFCIGTIDGTYHITKEDAIKLAEFIIKTYNLL